MRGTRGESAAGSSRGGRDNGGQSPSNFNLSNQQAEIGRLQDKNLQQKAVAAALAAAAVNNAATPATAQSMPQRNFERHNSVAATPDAIRKERDRLLKEKAQWGEHVKLENNILMQLLHDTRLGKALLQMEMDKLTEERHEIASLKLEHLAHNFEKTLAHLPLGERGVHHTGGELPLETQHKSDGVHAMMCAIARRARAGQETAIQDLLKQIGEAEEFFAKGGDITLKLHELKSMAENVGHVYSSQNEPEDKPTEVQDMPTKGAGGGKDSARNPSVASTGSTMRQQRQSTYGTNKGVSFSTNSTAHIISAMTSQQKEMDNKLAEAGEQRDHWKAEYESLKRKMTKMKVINAITKLTYGTHPKEKVGGAPSAGVKYDFVLPADTQGWESLPDNWKRVGIRCLRQYVKEQCSNHVRRDYVTTEGRDLIIDECTEHLKEILGHMMFTTATSIAGKTAPDEGIQHLCNAITNSLAMEREAYPLISMFLTYHGESMYVENREDEAAAEEPGVDPRAEAEQEMQRINNLNRRGTVEARAAAQAAAGEGRGGREGGDFGKEATRRVSTTAHHFSQPGHGTFAAAHGQNGHGSSQPSAPPPGHGPPRGKAPPPSGPPPSHGPVRPGHAPPPSGLGNAHSINERPSESVGSNFSFDQRDDAPRSPKKEEFSDSDSDGLN
jgi:hypothetical protein